MVLCCAMVRETRTMAIHIPNNYLNPSHCGGVFYNNVVGLFSTRHVDPPFLHVDPPRKVMVADLCNRYSCMLTHPCCMPVRFSAVDILAC